MSQIKGKLSDSIISLIKEKLIEEVPILQISHMLNVSRTAIYRIKNGIRPKRNGPKVTFDRKKLNFQVTRAVKAINKRGKKVTASKVLDLVSEPVKLRTLQRELKKMPTLSLRKNRKKIILKDNAKKNRLQILRDWFNQKINFSRIIFTDESRFSLDGPDNDVSWHLDDDAPILRPSRAMGGGSIMLFGLIASDGFLSIRKIDGTMNGEKYARLMDEDIIPMLKSRYKSNFIYQQDNARPHTSKKSMEIFTKHQISILKWPPYSPDLSPVENVWRIMKVEVYGNQIFQNKDELFEKITEVVADLNAQIPSKIKALYSSLISRYLNVIEKHGDNC